MRNLMSLLMTCSPEDVSRIAGRWGVELPRASKAERAAVLSRQMLRDSSAHRLWEGLDPPSRDLLFSFASQPERKLSQTGLARDAAPLSALLDAGVLWAFEESEREGGLPALALPPVADPTLVLPPELCRLTSRLRDDVEQGDVSGLPLDEQLRKLGTGELENLAAYWGLAAEPGSYTRDELLDSLLNKMSGASTERVSAEAPETARSLYVALVGAGGCAPTAALGEQLGISRPALRDAVADLGDRLLALETFDGSWRLFMPHGPRHSPPGRDVTHRLPGPISAPQRHVAAPQWAGAWDMTNLLRALELYEVPAGRDGGLPNALVERFESALTTRTQDPYGNLNFLYITARSLGLATKIDGTLKSTATMQSWAQVGLHAQSRRLLEYWAEHGLREEAKPLVGAAGYRQDTATMRTGRRILLERLAACEPGQWYPVTGTLELLEQEEPHLLRPQNRLVRDLGAAGARAALSDWQQREGQWAHAALAGPLAWLHVVEWTDGPPAAFMLTTNGAWLVGRVGRPPQRSESPRLSISDEGRIRVSAPDSALLWELAGCARAVRSGGRPGYLIDRRSIARARGAGLGPDVVLRLLRKHAENGVPPKLVSLIQEWGRDPHLIEVRPGLVVTCETEAGVEELMSSPIVRSHHPQRLGSSAVLLTLAHGDPNEERLVLLRRLTRSGLFSAEEPKG